MNKRNIQGFDILKIVSATLIIFHHYQQVFLVHFSGINFFDGAFNFGYLVELFFIISGILTGYSAKAGGGIRKSLIHKFLRIYPMATIVCAFTLIIKSVAAEDLGVLWNWKTLVANFLLVFSGWPYFAMTGINNPTWYLCVLIQCYLAYYIIQWLSQKVEFTRIWFDAAVIVATFGLHLLNLLPDSTYRGLEAFFVGVVLCGLREKIPEKKDISLVLVVVSAAAIILVPAQQRRIMTFITFPALAMFADSCIEIKNKGFERRIRTLGKTSFEVYILHYPMMALEQMITRVSGFEFTRTYLTMLAFAILIWLISYLTYRYVEKPINHMIKRNGT